MLVIILKSNNNILWLNIQEDIVKKLEIIKENILKNKHNGFIIVASYNKRFLDSAIFCAETLKEYYPEAHRYLVSNGPRGGRCYSFRVRGRPAAAKVCVLAVIYGCQW